MEGPYKMLYLLVTGFKKWEEKSETIPHEVHSGHRLFIKECAKNEVEPPVELTQLVKILELPSNQWGIPNLDEIYPPDAKLLDKEIGVTIEAEDFLEEIQSPDEYEQSKMKQILLYCRKYKLDNTYREIRTFLSNPKHSVIPFQKLYEFKGKINDEKLVQLFSSCYENVENIEQYRLCPNCGWTLEWKNGHWRCNKENVCHNLADFKEVEPFQKSAYKVLRMKSGIQKYILLPGISELRIAEKLKKKGYNVLLYPNIDEFDIHVEKDGKKLLIDVKDYYNPFQLAIYINRKNLSDLSRAVWYVVPDYRCKLFPKYQKRVMNLLQEDRRNIVKVFSEADAINKAGGFFNEKTTT